ncbi:MAG: AI-2E family transporter YdiK [Burkholderiales bacterium]|nr:MAG: AI-2E family transporter YdiK [Burkholderiales bacterium]
MTDSTARPSEPAPPALPAADDDLRAAPPPAAVQLSLSAPELTRTVLAIMFLIAMIAGSFWVLQPFIPAMIWATTIVIATWPLMTGAQRLLWGRRGLAVAAMTTALLLLFFVPLSLAIATVVDNADTLVGWFKAAATFRFGEPPAWLASVPLVGARAAAYWRELAASGVEPLIAKVAPYAGTVASRVLREAGVIGAVGLQLLMTVVISAILYATGESAGGAVLRFSRRLAGRRGENTALLAAASIRGVALGVVVTAVAQSLLGAIGLAVVGVPAVALLAALMFLLAIAQIGVIPVLLPAVIWLFWSGDTGWAIVLAIWTAFVGTMDNFLRPWLIKKGANLPILLIFVGVVGGLIAFGLVGIFIGPVVLAVTYTLLGAWMDERTGPPRTPPED